MQRTIFAIFLVLAVAVIVPARASKSEMCESVSFGTMNWTGVSAKTALAAWMLKQLGYETKVETVNVPLVFLGLAQGGYDAALGLWVPVSRKTLRPHMVSGDINIIATNLKDARVTLAVPGYVAKAGVNTHADLDRFKEKFEGKIYALEPGGSGNRAIKKMIADDAYGLGDWKIVESSEAGMLAEAKRRIARDEWVVFMGWTPHSMTLNLDMEFVDGASKYWGANGGRNNVYTGVHPGFAWKCPNVGQFLRNYTFTLEEQSRLIKYAIDQDMTYLSAGKKLVRQKPELLERWFGQGGLYQDGAVTASNGTGRGYNIVKKKLSGE